MNDQQDTTSDGWGARYLAPIENQNVEWAVCFSKTLEIVQRGGITILIGKRGSGKTRIAAEISRGGNFPGDILGKAKTSCYRRIAEILCELRAAMKGEQGEMSVIRRLSSCGLLIIDEFHERGETEWENRMITTIIDRRYAENLPTILIANLDPDEVARKISDSVISRVNESGGAVVCNCGTFR
jgi:DNA replication protein DnaC